jgi:hypothetical protein
MDNNSQTDSFMFDLDNLIRRYQQEFDLNDQTIVGALEFAKLTVLTVSHYASYNKRKDGLQNVRITINDGTTKAAVYKRQQRR